MAKKVQPKKNWNRKNGALLATRLRGVGTCIKGSSYFKTPVVAPEDMMAQGDKLDTAYNNRLNGLVGRETYKVVLADSNAMMEKVAGYVGEVAEGNPEIIVAADFEPTKTSGSKKVVPQAPNPPALKNANGEISMMLKRVKGASSYCYVVFVGEASDVTVMSNQIQFPVKANVVVFPASSTRECLKGIASGTRVFVAALAQNASGKSPLSPLVSICAA